MDQNYDIIQFDFFQFLKGSSVKGRERFLTALDNKKADPANLYAFAEEVKTCKY